MLPGAVQVVFLDRRGQQRRVVAEVALVDLAQLIDHEGRDARDTILGRRCDHREPADHVAIDDVVVAPARRSFTLAGQDPEIVATDRIAGIAALQIAALFGDEGQQGTGRFVRAFGRFPIESILLAGAADEGRRIFQHLVAVAVDRGIIALCVHEGAQRIESRQLVATDPARQQLVEPLLRDRSSTPCRRGRSGTAPAIPACRSGPCGCPNHPPAGSSAPWRRPAPACDSPARPLRPP